MAFAVTAIQQNTSAAGATRTLTVPVGGVPSGSLIVICSGDSSNAAANTSSVADDGGNTYTFQQGISCNNITANGFSAIFTAPATTGLTSGQFITYTKAVSGSSCRTIGFYVTGHDPTTPVDAAASAANAGNSTTTTVTSGTPAVAASLFIGMFSHTVTGSTITHPGGWTQILDGTATREAGAEYIVGSGTSTQTYNPTFATAKNYANCIIVISPPAAGGSVFTPYFFLQHVARQP